MIMSSDNQHPYSSSSSLHLEILRDELQNLKDEIQLEKRKQANIHQRIATTLRDNQIALPDPDLKNTNNHGSSSPPRHLQQDLKKMINHYTKIQQLLSIQIKHTEERLTTATADADDHDEDQDRDLTILLATLKQDLADADEQLEALHRRNPN